MKKARLKVIFFLGGGGIARLIRLSLLPSPSRDVLIRLEMFHTDDVVVRSSLFVITKSFIRALADKIIFTVIRSKTHKEVKRNLKSVFLTIWSHASLTLLWLLAAMRSGNL